MSEVIAIKYRAFLSYSHKDQATAKLVMVNIGPEDARPVSLRLLAKRLQLSPSTVSRALSHRSIQLPWGLETPMIAFVPGQRRVLKDILALWIAADPAQADAELARERAVFYGSLVPS